MDHSAIRTADRVAGNCAKKTYRMTSATSAITANCERSGLKRFATYPTASSKKQHELVAASQSLLSAHPPALERGSVNGVPSARPIRNGSASIETTKITSSESSPANKATQVRRYFGEEFKSLFILHSQSRGLKPWTQGALKRRSARPRHSNSLAFAKSRSNKNSSSICVTAFCRLRKVGIVQCNTLLLHRQVTETPMAVANVADLIVWLRSVFVCEGFN